MTAKANAFDVGDYVVYPKHGVGRVIELQARLLAKWLTGEIPDYVPMVTR